MHRTAAQILLSIVILLAITATSFVASDSRRLRQARPRAIEFQRLVGGFGCGGELDESRCAFGLDPRLQSQCSEWCGAIPGGGPFCVCHGFSVFYFPSLPRFAHGDSLEVLGMEVTPDGGAD